jgi:hypothetical protein
LKNGQVKLQACDTISWLFEFRKLLMCTKHGWLLASLLVLYGTVALLLAISIQENKGYLLYALDDPYIHMAIAKNFVEHHVWGVTRYEFSSCISSIIWPLLISLTYASFGISQAVPLILNLFFAGVVLILAYAILRHYDSPSAYTFLVLLAIIFFTPLPTLIFDGLEHSLQTATAILATYLSARVLSKEASDSRRESFFLLALAPLVTAVRFEGIFMVLAITGLFLLRRRWTYGAVLGVGGFLPVATYGVISASHGWFWLPNPILLKGKFPNLASLSDAIESLLGPAYLNLKVAPHLLVLILSALALFALTFDHERGLWESRKIVAVIFIATGLLHVGFASVGWFFRYEAYLVALGILVVAVQIIERFPKGSPRSTFDKRLLPKYAAIAVLGALVLFPLAERGSAALWFTPTATTNIFQQQYQMGLFIKQFYQGSSIALNDIGAVNFLADVHCLDLEGLANLEVAKKRRKNRFHTQDIRQLAAQAGARLAMVYDPWYGGKIGGLPPQWTRVGQ